MFFHADIKGDRLPPGTLCLTFDDGPGPDTAELGAFLAERGVRATFFVIGRHAEAYPEVLAGLDARGHLIGNHTYGHPGLVACATAGGDVLGEVARTDEVIRDHVAGSVVFLRAPYGNWRETTGPGGGEDRPTSIVAGILEASGRFPRHVGPINWDISNEDWTYWERGLPAEDCARSCLAEIGRVGRGIVLMHDSSEDEASARNNRALGAMKIVVPALLERGYAFVGLDAVPQVDSATKVSALVALRAPDGRYVSAWDGGVVADGDSIGFREQLGVVRLGGDQVALRASHGLYLSARPGGDLAADAQAIGDRERFGMEGLGADRVAFRASDGRFVTWRREGGRVHAARSRRGPGIFEVTRLLGTSGATR